MVKNNQQTLEIERKWLLPALPEKIHHANLEEVKAVEIRQYYLAIDSREEIRLRRKGKDYYRTRKVGNGLVRIEEEEKITEEQFEALMEKKIGHLLRKWRFSFKVNGYCLEFDQFEDHRQGLILLEVEFKTEAEASLFTLPEWIVDAEEVTNDPQYQNKNLALQD